jgi:hypothetical protein
MLHSDANARAEEKSRPAGYRNAAGSSPMAESGNTGGSSEEKEKKEDAAQPAPPPAGRQGRRHIYKSQSPGFRH